MGSFLEHTRPLPPGHGLARRGRLAPRRFVWNETGSFHRRRGEQAGRQMLEHAHVSLHDLIR